MCIYGATTTPTGPQHPMPIKRCKVHANTLANTRAKTKGCARVRGIVAAHTHTHIIYRLLRKCNQLRERGRRRCRRTRSLLGVKKPDANRIPREISPFTRSTTCVRARAPARPINPHHHSHIREKTTDKLPVFNIMHTHTRVSSTI